VEQRKGMRSEFAMEGSGSGGSLCEQVRHLNEKQKQLLECFAVLVFWWVEAFASDFKAFA